MSFCVGLTGGIASGKSTVAKAFEELGVPLIDADQVARDVVAPGSEGLAQVIAHFGERFLTADGQLDRRQMRQHVFAAPERRKELESILHPRIRSAIEAWRHQLPDDHYGILMAPIMREGGFDRFCDRMLVVDVSRDTQKQRLMLRDEVDETLAEQMLNAQSTQEERLAMADDVLDNGGDMALIRPRVEALHRQYMEIAGV